MSYIKDAKRETLKNVTNVILTRWGQHLECTFGKYILAWFHNLLAHIKTFTKQKSRSDIFDRYFKMFPYCPIGP